MVIVQQQSPQSYTGDRLARSSSCLSMHVLVSIVSDSASCLRDSATSCRMLPSPDRQISAVACSRSSRRADAHTIKLPKLDKAFETTL